MDPQGTRPTRTEPWPDRHNEGRKPARRDGPGAAGRTDKPTASQRANAEMETRSAGPAAPRSLRAGGRGGASGTLFA
ncbi:unnamed protein product [Rangifer tarandus platyrhynchus]|uniref:Uncharacterized protein n=1 Tax=Rangifer tarandus platyrhynchus TaxID=3082113 RepID=A0ABN8Z813_RANTA|nr:unnamed protein product [Rangifer tarandus platyrhynchus]CAI9688293.1 unnamed protein product [Rangifer tarandus platyrhynchus]